MQTSTERGEARALPVGGRALVKLPDQANAGHTLDEGSDPNERRPEHFDAGNSPTNPALSKPETGDCWLRLEQDIGRLFSAEPLYAVRSLGTGGRDKLFYGRAAEMRRMVHAVHEPAKHILLYGERGVGKTSLGNTFWRGRNLSTYPFWAARVQARPSDDFSSLWSRALDEFQTVFQYYIKKIRSNFAHVSPDIVRTEFQKAPGHLGAIMIIDDFDLLRDPEARELTAHLLKCLHDHAINVTVLLIGVAGNAEELIVNHQLLRRVLSIIKLNRLNTGELADILDSRLRLASLEISAAARSEIANLSFGLPYYVQTIAKLAAQSAIKYQRPQVKIEDVNTAIASFLDQESEAFLIDYQKATEDSFPNNIFRDVILASALTSCNPDGDFDAFEVLKALNIIAPDKDYHHEYVEQYLAEFTSDRRAGILRRVQAQTGDRYQFSDARMQPIIVMKSIKDGILDEKLRHLLFHSIPMEERAEKLQIEIEEADARNLRLIIPPSAGEADRKTANKPQARQFGPIMGGIAAVAALVILLVHSVDPASPPAASEAALGTAAETSAIATGTSAIVGVGSGTATGNTSTTEPEPVAAAADSPTSVATPVEPAPVAPSPAEVPSTVNPAAPWVSRDRPRLVTREIAGPAARGDSIIGTADGAAPHERASEAGEGRAARLSGYEHKVSPSQAPKKITPPSSGTGGLY
jgi:GTPase SAR1 family protein